MLVESELARLILTDMSSQQIVVLKEKEGPRAFPIVIGFFEAMAIDRQLKGLQVERPLTHDLLKSTIEEMGGRLSRIVVNDLRDNTFFAYLEVALDGQTVRIDSRPSDALALAVRTNAAIYIDDKVFGLAAASA